MLRVKQHVTTVRAANLITRFKTLQLSRQMCRSLRGVHSVDLQQVNGLKTERILFLYLGTFDCNQLITNIKPNLGKTRRPNQTQQPGNRVVKTPRSRECTQSNN